MRARAAMMKNYPHPIIAREGWPFLGLAALVAAALTWFGWIVPAVLAWIAFVFILQFFRDPARAIPQGPKSVLSPADGRVVLVETARDPYLDRDALKISVFMNVFNVHSNRSRNALHLRTPSGQDVTCVQIAGLIARRILCYVDTGATLARGQRYGFIRFGSRVDVYLDPLAVPRVAVGDVVSATETVLAELP